jgi:hypothetical protein
MRLLGIALALILAAVGCRSDDEAPPTFTVTPSTETPTASPTSADRAALEACGTSAPMDGGHILEAAYATTAASVSAWFNAQPDPYEAMPPDDLIAVCFVAGEFGKSPPPPADPEATPWPSYDRALFLVHDDVVTSPGTVMGYSEELATETGAQALTLNAGPPRTPVP